MSRPLELEDVMSREMDVTERILKAVVKAPGCRMEDVVFGCPDLPWNQIFLEVDRLSRAGTLLLKLEGRGLYTLWSPPIRGKGVE